MKHILALTALLVGSALAQDSGVIGQYDYLYAIDHVYREKHCTPPIYNNINYPLLYGFQADEKLWQIKDTSKPAQPWALRCAQKNGFILHKSNGNFYTWQDIINADKCKDLFCTE